MKTLSDFYQLFPNRPVAAPAPRPTLVPSTATRPEPAPLARPDRYRERGVGTGYGRSSGYAAARSYSTDRDQRLIRVG